MRYRALFALFCCVLCGAALAQSYPTPQFYQAPLNLTLAASVASNELTIAIDDPNGNVPAASHPVLLGFRSTTLSSGALAFVAVTAATAFTTGAITDSMGCTTAVLCRLWVWAIDNAGTVNICAYNADTSSSVIDLSESVLQTSQSGTGGGTSAQALYCNASAVATKAVRRLGYVEATWTSGTGWSGPTTVQLFGPGIHKAGEVVTRVSSGIISSSTNLQTTETQTAIVAAITPGSATDLVLVRASVSINQTGGHTGTIRISRGTTPTLIGPTANYNIVTVAGATQLPLEALDNPATTSSVSYYIYGTSDSNNQAIVNSTGTSEIILEEIMGKLDEPVNDNVNPGVFAMTG